MIVKATTALNKICSLKKRIRGIQGGQGAGKTIAILIILIDYCKRHSNKEVYIISDELTKMRNTVIKDFVKVMSSFNLFQSDRFTSGTFYQFANGSFIKFISTDKEDVGKGLRSDVVFVNEANKIKFEAFREVTSRAKNIYIDFNPNKMFWFHSEILNRSDCQFLKLTFADNEFLSDTEKTEILGYKEKAFNPDNTIKSKYWYNIWRVYGLGELGSAYGLVFPDFEIINEPPKEAIFRGYGMDFGYNDPTVLTGIYTNGYDLIIDEVLYKTGLVNFSENNEKPSIVNEFKRLGIKQTDTIVADSAEPKSISELRQHDFLIYSAMKGPDSVLKSIRLINSFNIKITKKSLNVINDFRNYSFKPNPEFSGQYLDQPIDLYKHSADSVGYFMQLTYKRFWQ